MKEEKLYKRHQGWIFWLTGMWLLATFEHNYYTLGDYSLHKVWTIFGTDIPISDISTFLMVMALELTLFWSVSFIPTGKRWSIKLTYIYIIQFVSTFISMVLNIKYMIEASPTPTVMDYTIGAVVGGLIPVFVILFGYVEGHVFDTRIEMATGKKVTRETLKKVMVENPGLTRRKMAEKLGVSATTIQNIVNGMNKDRMDGEN